MKRPQNLQLAELAEQLEGLEPQEELESFRVWPCGTVQSIEEGDPYSHLSDDFLVIQAPSEEDALRLAEKI